MLETKLPFVFAVIDMSPVMPSRFYIFISYELESHPLQVVQNTKVNYNCNVWTIGSVNISLINNHQFMYKDTHVNDVFWYTGIDVSPNDGLNNLIPVLDFKHNILLQNSALSCVFIANDDILTKIQHQNIVRDKREQVLTLIRPHLNDIPTTRPAVQQTELSQTLNEFQLPTHAAATFVRGLIQQKISCSITANSFNEIAVIGITPCFHCFDYEAIQKWLLTKQSCPECRANIRSCSKYIQL